MTHARRARRRYYYKNVICNTSLEGLSHYGHRFVVTYQLETVGELMKTFQITCARRFMTKLDSAIFILPLILFPLIHVILSLR